MHRFFKYFQFNAVERRGFIVLTLAVLLVNICVIVYKWIRPREAIIHQLHALQEEYSKHEDENDNALNISRPYTNHIHVSKEVNYFMFDPNTTTAAQWAKLGLSSKQTQVILNYLAKGGHFYKREDLKKIYSISEKEYNKLAPYIHIESKSSSGNASVERKESKIYQHTQKTILITLNTADTTEIKKLKGIGSVLAARIVKFRDALGGFHNISQLQEVYGIKAETYMDIKDNLIISGHQIKKLNINTIDADLLSRHPYVSKKQAQIIINYRAAHGPYVDLNNLSQNKALDQEFLRKIEPYLEF